MKKKVIGELERLYKHKQEQLVMQTNQLQQKKTHLLSEVDRYQDLVRNLYADHADCKSLAYNHTFQDALMSSNDIKTVHHDLQQLIKIIGEHNQSQQQITEQINRLDDQMIALKQQLRYCIVKEEKYYVAMREL